MLGKAAEQEVQQGKDLALSLMGEWLMKMMEFAETAKLISSITKKIHYLCLLLTGKPFVDFLCKIGGKMNLRFMVWMIRIHYRKKSYVVTIE